MDRAFETRELKKLRAELAALCDAMTAMERRYARHVRAAHPLHRDSARNLLHYLALRQRDLRALQQSLRRLGLSSLEKGESGALGSVETVLATVERLLGRGRRKVQKTLPASRNALRPEQGRALLARHTRALLGSPLRGRRVRIMVTMPGEAAMDLRLMRGLLERGMNVMRINCAHDRPDIWARMIKNLREVEKSGRCRVFMDLAGPKPRTGPIAPGEAVVCLRPTRDALGRVVAKARVLLIPASSSSPGVSGPPAAIPVASAWLARRRVGEIVRFLDARASPRKIEIVQCCAGGVWAESDQTCYVTPGTLLYVQLEEDGYDESWLRDETPVGVFPVAEQRIPLRKGERLVLTRDMVPGEPTMRDGRGEVACLAHVGVTLPAMLARVRPGDRVWFDDGKIGGVVRRRGVKGVEVEITSTGERGKKLGAGKSINLPDTPAGCRALTARDAKDIGFVARRAEMVGLSFVHTASEIRRLQTKLAAEGAEAVGLVVKIENRSAYERLPELLLAAMRSPIVGVLIGRGDLAVECGYERLAEIQEEILRLSAAAHLPVFWATQVLEKLVQKGTPSRAEITDAAAAERATCVMLNKGPYIFPALETLDAILRRMASHAAKRQSHLRSLRVAKQIGRTNT
jgi:pyruvate kinase